MLRLSVSKNTYTWLTLLAFLLIFILITLALTFSGGATALPLIGFWFANMSTPLGCLLAGFCLTGVLFITFKILELFGQALNKLFNWLKSSSAAQKISSPTQLTPPRPSSTERKPSLVQQTPTQEELIRSIQQCLCLNSPSTLVHEPSIYLLQKHLPHHFPLFVNELMKVYLTPTGLCEALKKLEVITLSSESISTNLSALAVRKMLIEIDNNYQLNEGEIKKLPNASDSIYAISSPMLKRPRQVMLGLTFPITLSTQLCYEAIFYSVMFQTHIIISYGLSPNSEIKQAMEETYRPQIITHVSQAFIAWLTTAPEILNGSDIPPSPMPYHPHPAYTEPKEEGDSNIYNLNNMY